MHTFRSKNEKNLEIHFYNLIDSFKNSRPTARNLFYALDRMKSVFENTVSRSGALTGESAIRPTIHQIENILLDVADKIFDEDIELCSRIGVNGSELIVDGMNILTHCNTGELAAGGIGTAQGIITTAYKQAKKIFVYVDETRPLLQGARLTAYEFIKNNIDFELIIDSMAANLMKESMIDCVLIGADRIASNGDVVNKIGSYSLAVNCAYHKIPFYVAAPGTTIDFDIESGDKIEIEERSPDEILCIAGNPVAPKNANVFNAAFDLVPNNLVTAIITEYKIHYPPYDFKSLKHMFSTSEDDLRGTKRRSNPFNL
jgi:methylthioribose-1-phosphate isomerase